jgi:hypothetical protein
MRPVRFVALSEDGQALVLADEVGRLLSLPVDEKVSGAIRHDRAAMAFAGQGEPGHPEAALSPRDIQSRIRSGDSAEEVARIAGVPVDRVLRYAGPVLQERAMLAQHARRTRLRSSERGATLAEIVDTRLAQHGVDAEGVSWDAHRRDDGTWRVVASWASGKATAQARWALDKARQVVTPDDDMAHFLSTERPAPLLGQDPEPEAPPRPTRTTSSRTAPRAMPTRSGHALTRPDTDDAGRGDLANLDAARNRTDPNRGGHSLAPTNRPTPEPARPAANRPATNRPAAGDPAASSGTGPAASAGSGPDLRSASDFRSGSGLRPTPGRGGGAGDGDVLDRPFAAPRRPGTDLPGMPRPAAEPFLPGRPASAAGGSDAGSVGGGSVGGGVGDDGGQWPDSEQLRPTGELRRPGAEPMRRPGIGDELPDLPGMPSRPARPNAEPMRSRDAEPVRGGRPSMPLRSTEDLRSRGGFGAADEESDSKDLPMVPSLAVLRPRRTEQGATSERSRLPSWDDVLFGNGNTQQGR